MEQKTLEKLNRNVLDLKKEMKVFRSFAVGVLGRDEEGEYNPDFVKKILGVSSESASFHFKNKTSFLSCFAH